MYMYYTNRGIPSCIEVSLSIAMNIGVLQEYFMIQIIVFTAHSTQNKLLWHCVEAQCENTKRRLLLFSYGNIIRRHLQIYYILHEHTLIINIWII